MKRKRRTTRVLRREKLLAHLRRAEESKVPLAAYCRAQGLNIQSAYNLRHRLRRSDAQARRRGPIATEREVSDPFVAVRVAPVAVPASAAFRLQSKGWVIECARLPPAEWLAGVMRGDADAVS